MTQAAYLLLGLAGGIASGIFGIGGGVVLIPAMVFLFGLTQHQAQGTTLAVLVPPIGLLAALRYYYSGNVKIDMALFVCLGFFVGGFIGASLIQGVPDLVLKRLFGVFMLVIAVRMIVSN